MNYTRFFTIAALVLAASCTEDSSMPTDTRPQFGQGGTSGNPSYKSSVFTFVTSTKGLNHSWRQTGMGNFTNVPYSLTADATITAHCENKGGNTVNGAPFQVSQSLSSGPRTFPQRNGSINGTIDLTPEEVECQPPGGNPHAAIIDAAVYFNIKFCWGKEGLVTALQGPVPGGPGSDATVPPSPQNGLPTDGSEAQSLGIFSACTST